MTSREEVRLVAGFFLMPFVSGILGVALFPALLYSRSWVTGHFGTLHTPAGAALGFGLGVAMIGVLVTAFGAIPAVLLLKRFGALSLRRLVMTGVVLGNVPLFLIVLVSTAVQLSKGVALEEIGHLWYGVSGILRLVVIGTIVGTISSAVFWVVTQVRGVRQVSHA